MQNIELVPKSELDKIAELDKLLQNTDATIVKTAEDILTFNKNIKKTGNTIKALQENGKKYNDLAAKYNDTARKQNEILSNRKKIVADVVSAESNQVKQAKELNKTLKECSALEQERLRLQKEISNLKGGNDSEVKALDRLKRKLEEVNDELRKKTALEDIYFGGSDSSESIANAIEEENRRFEERAALMEEYIPLGERYSELNEENAKSTKELSDMQIAAQQAFDTLGERLQMESQKLVELQLDLKNVRKEKDELDKLYQSGAISQDAYILKTAELSTLERSLADSIKNTSDKIKYETIIVREQEGSYKSVSAQYSLLRMEINRYGETVAKGGKLTEEEVAHKRELEAQSKALYDRMIEMEGVQGRSQLKVGKYNEAVTELTRTVSLLDPQLGMIVRKVQNINVVKKAWIQVNEFLVNKLGMTARAATIAQLAFVGFAVGGLYFVITAIKKYISKQIEAQKEVKEFEQSINTMGITSKKNATSELVRLKLLSKATQDSSLSINDRKKAVNTLQKEYPKYLGNLSQEEILAGKGADAMDRLAESILKKAKAQAAEQKIVELSGQLIDIEEKRFNLEDQNENHQKVINRIQNLLDESSNSEIILSYQDQIDSYNRKISRTNKELGELDTETEKINNRVKRVMDGIDLSGLLEGINDDNPINPINPIKDNLLKYLDGELKAIQDLSDLELEILVDLNKEILKDEKASYDERLKALDSYIMAQNGLIGQNAEFQINSLVSSYMKDNEGATEADALRALEQQILFITEKMNFEQTKLSREGAESRVEITKDEVARIAKLRENELTDTLTALKTSESEQLKALSEMYAKGEIKAEEYSKQRLEIQRNTQKAEFEAELAMFDDLLDNQKLTDEQREEYTRKRAEKQAEFNKYLTEIDIQNNEEEVDREEALLEKKKELLQEFGNFAMSIMDAITEKQLEELDKQMEAYQEHYDERLRQIETLEESGAISTEQANARKASAEQELRDKEKEIEEERKEAERRQFLAQQAMAATQIIINTAEAVTKQLALTPLPIGAPFVALIKGIGVVQLATVLAQTVAAYKDGTDYHHGGLAWVGDGFRSEAIEINGRIYKSPAVPTLVDLPKGTAVYPDYDKYVDSLISRPISGEWRTNDTTEPYNDRNVIYMLGRSVESVNKFMKLYGTDISGRKIDNRFNNKNENETCQN